MQSICSCRSHSGLHNDMLDYYSNCVTSLVDIAGSPYTTTFLHISLSAARFKMLSLFTLKSLLIILRSLLTNSIQVNLLLPLFLLHLMLIAGLSTGNLNRCPSHLKRLCFITSDQFDSLVLLYSSYSFI